MKKEYTAPEIEVVTFATDDIMTASGTEILNDILQNGESSEMWE